MSDENTEENNTPEWVPPPPLTPEQKEAHRREAMPLVYELIDREKLRQRRERRATRIYRELKPFLKFGFAGTWLFLNLSMYARLDTAEKGEFYTVFWWCVLGVLLLLFVFGYLFDKIDAISYWIAQKLWKYL